MSATSHDPALAGGADPALDGLIEELTRRIQAGEWIDPREVADAHPEHAEALRRLLPALEMMAELGGAVVSEASRVGPPRIRLRSSAGWATSGSSASWAGAAWGSSTRPSRSRCAVGSR